MSIIANIPESEKKRVVIIGAGFGGLTLAKKIDTNLFQVVLVDKNNFHSFQPLYYQVATAGIEPSSISFPLRKIFQSKTDVHIRICEVENIVSDYKYIETDIGRINYDYLVIGIGADTNFYNNQQIIENSLPMKSVSEALAIRNHILSCLETALLSSDADFKKRLLNIVVVGAGPTGVEVSGTLAEMKKTVLPKDYPEMDFNLMQVTLVQSADRVLPSMSEVSSKHALKFLQKLGVHVLLNSRVSSYDGETVTFTNHEPIATKSLIWTAGVKANFIHGLNKECIHSSGRILVNEFNQVNGYDNIFAIGDVALMKTVKWENGHPQIAQPAIQQGKLVADNLKNLQSSKSMIPFKYRDFGSMATVGKNLAVVELPFFKFQGFRAWLFWMFIHLMAIVGAKNRVFIFMNWLWNYITSDQSLRLIIKPRGRNKSRTIEQEMRGEPPQER